MLGPILYFRGLTEGRCQLAALVVLPAGETPPYLTTADGSVGAEDLGGRLGKTVWRYTFSLPLDGDAASEYAIGEQAWRVYPPAGERLRIAFTACNGGESDRPGDDYPERNERWRHLAREHAIAPFHLLLQGGDQLYADYVWKAIPELAEWEKQKRPLSKTLSPAAVEAIHDFYFEMYCWLWGQADLAPLIASIPSRMMWDDHDIFDGWGSHSAKLQNSPVFRTVWEAARDHFVLFQLAGRPDQPPTLSGKAGGNPDSEHYGWAFAIDRFGIICPDLRTERTQHQVMGKAGWEWFIQTLAQFGHCRHVFLLSTVPLINTDLSFIERLVAPLPSDHLMQDDLRDQWRSYAHRQEWQRMVNQLLNFSEQTRTCCTVLSGEIHLGALGRISRGDTELYQLISSGIVHPPPPKAYASALNLLGFGASTIAPDTTLAMLHLPNLNTRYITARNWLSLDCAPDGTVQARWHAEDIAADLSLDIPGPESSR